MYMDKFAYKNERKNIKAITREVLQFLACTNDTEAQFTYDSSMNRFDFTVRSAYDHDNYRYIMNGADEEESEETEDEERSE